MDFTLDNMGPLTAPTGPLKTDLTDSCASSSVSTELLLIKLMVHFAEHEHASLFFFF